MRRTFIAILFTRCAAQDSLYLLAFTDGWLFVLID
jgi:hypothetical protein